ncbi:MAG: cyclic nucleotide-binding/CBS domain-containing protein, partial [Chromatiales bacterium]
MEIELQEIRDFVADIIPFNLLPDEVLDNLPAQLQIRYLRRGSDFPPENGVEDYLYIVRSGAIEIRDNDNTLINKLAENDYYSDCLVLDRDQY